MSRKELNVLKNVPKTEDLDVKKCQKQQILALITHQKRVNLAYFAA
jgi:hypothetical protein